MSRSAVRVCAGPLEKVAVGKMAVGSKMQIAMKAGCFDKIDQTRSVKEIEILFVRRLRPQSTAR